MNYLSLFNSTHLMKVLKVSYDKSGYYQTVSLVFSWKPKKLQTLRSCGWCEGWNIHFISSSSSSYEHLSWLKVFSNLSFHYRFPSIGHPSSRCSLRYSFLSNHFVSPKLMMGFLLLCLSIIKFFKVIYLPFYFFFNLMNLVAPKIPSNWIPNFLLILISNLFFLYFLNLSFQILFSLTWI